MFHDGSISVFSKKEDTNHSRISVNVVSLLQAALRGSSCEVFNSDQSCLSIQEYVLISTQEQTVDVYRRASDKLWTLHHMAVGLFFLLVISYAVTGNA